MNERLRHTIEMAGLIIFTALIVGLLGVLVGGFFVLVWTSPASLTLKIAFTTVVSLALIGFGCIAISTMWEPGE